MVKSAFIGLGSALFITLLLPPLTKRPTLQHYLLTGLLAVALVMLPGCTTLTGSSSFPSPQQTDHAIVQGWLTTVGHPMANLPKIQVNWSNTCVTRPSTGECVDAYSLANNEVCVMFVKWEGNIWASRFSHELIHCLQAANTSPDPMHERVADWQLEPKIERVLWSQNM